MALLGISGCASTRDAAPVREASFSSRTYPPAPVGYYRIQRGDTLYKIAFENGLDYRDLAAWNKLPDAGVIRSGELLSLLPPKAALASKPPAAAKPATSVQQAPPKRANVVTPVVTPAVKPVETRPLAARPVIAAAKVVKAPLDPLPPAEEDAAAPAFWIWPTQGQLLTRYGEGLSKGIDIAGQRGHPIQAAAPGKVVYAGSGLRGYGKLIIIRHSMTLLSAYAHAERILVTEGQNIASGQPIAEMGDTDTDRVKLHFEIREFGKPVDPLNYLPKQS